MFSGIPPLVSVYCTISYDGLSANDRPILNTNSCLVICIVYLCAIGPRHLDKKAAVFSLELTSGFLPSMSHSGNSSCSITIRKTIEQQCFALTTATYFGSLVLPRLALLLRVFNGWHSLVPRSSFNFCGCNWAERIRRSGITATRITLDTIIEGSGDQTTVGMWANTGAKIVGSRVTSRAAKRGKRGGPAGKIFVVSFRRFSGFRARFSYNKIGRDYRFGHFLTEPGIV